MKIGVMATACVLLGSSGLAPTASEAQAYDPADVESIDAIIAAVYDVISGEAGEPRDWERWHSLFAEGATLGAVGMTPSGEPRRARMTPESYVAQSGGVLERDGFFEAEIGRVTERYGMIAHAFSTYESYRSAADEEPFARGINSFQLMHDGTRWWVVSIFWQGESAAFPIPDKYIGEIRD
ncbi:MAG: hypothetical protein OEN56_10345 [Gemmatimonadota bacterium]|nr:hypothetical protein [Gemmatimonadota bacterium]